ncbi:MULTISPECIES: hypothetical protein [Rothia]|uniref:hypothetical protein n=1 Tax=Rothia TaxID=32207 RepID=UPI0015D6F021|nr:MULTISPECIES: hypothetical protein [Rothia]
MSEAVLAPATGAKTALHVLTQLVECSLQAIWADVFQIELRLGRRIGKRLAWRSLIKEEGMIGFDDVS